MSCYVNWLLVIGGGTGGLTVAHQLASSSTVAVIEAGGFYEIQNGNGSIIPAQAPLQSVGELTRQNDIVTVYKWLFKMLIGLCRQPRKSHTPTN